jgi:hypothetical protein
VHSVYSVHWVHSVHTGYLVVYIVCIGGCTPHAFNVHIVQFTTRVTLDLCVNVLCCNDDVLNEYTSKK